MDILLDLVKEKGIVKMIIESYDDYEITKKYNCCMNEIINNTIFKTDNYKSNLIRVIKEENGKMLFIRSSDYCNSYYDTLYVSTIFRPQKDIELDWKTMINCRGKKFNRSVYIYRVGDGYTKYNKFNY